MPGVRIEDLIRAHLLAGRIGVATKKGSLVSAEIARAFRCVGDLRDGIAGEVDLAELLKAEEEEGLVVTVVDFGNNDRPASVNP